MTHPCPYALTAGSFVLGVLPPRESDEFRLHADECLDCRREIAELTPTARLLKTFKAQAHAAAGEPTRPDVYAHFLQDNW